MAPIFDMAGTTRPYRSAGSTPGSAGQINAEGLPDLFSRLTGRPAPSPGLPSKNGSFEARGALLPSPIGLTRDEDERQNAQRASHHSSGSSAADSGLLVL